MLAIDHLTYDEVISNIAKVVEAIGALIMVIGGLWAFLNFGFQTLMRIPAAVVSTASAPARPSHSHWVGISDRRRHRSHDHCRPHHPKCDGTGDNRDHTDRPQLLP